MMNAKELHDALSANPTSGTEIAVLAAANMPTILRALSLLAAAEANDGTTPETDAARDFTWRCEHHPEHQGGMVTTRMIEARLFEEADELRGFARRLELERNGLARAHADALEENARLKERVAIDDTEREYRRQSLANEIRETLKVRGHFAAERPSDLIGCVARAIESERDRANLAEAELAALREQLAERDAELDSLRRSIVAAIDGKPCPTPAQWIQMQAIIRAAYPKEADAMSADKITSSETPRTLPEYVKCITDDGQELPMRRCPACKKPSFIGYRCDGCDLAAERERADRNERDAERWRYWRVRPTHWNWFSARSIHTWKTPAQLDADTDAAIDAARGKK